MLETAQEIGAYVLDEFSVLVEEIGDGLEFGIELDALLLELQVGETELCLIGTGQGQPPAMGPRSLVLATLSYSI